MKNLTTIFILVVLAAGAAFAGDAEYGITVPATTSTVILPPRVSGYRTGLWTTNAVVANGEILKVLSTGEEYLVLVGGTTSATNYPSATGGQTEISGTVTAVHCDYKAPRTKGLSTQEADVSVWYHTGLSATTNGGEYAYIEGQQYGTDESGPVSVYTSAQVKLNIKDK